MGAVGFECSTTTLLCPEDKTLALDFDDEECVDTGGVALGGDEHQDGVFRGSLSVDFPLQSDECLALLLSKESDHMPEEDYCIRLESGDVDLSVRREAIDWIWKVHGHYSFGPLTAYLSINYLDRFLSSYRFPQGKPWTIQLLSVACLSLASKMEENAFPLPLDLQVIESKYVFETATIQRMELLVLSTLNWRLLAVTPFSFVDYFLRRFNGDKSPPRPVFSKSVKLILDTIGTIEFLRFNPSEIAAAVARSVLGEDQEGMVDREVQFYCFHVNKERLSKTCEMIRNLPSMNGRSPVSSTPHSPIGVLDAACLSYKSSDKTVESQANSHQASLDSKRRKIDRPPTS